MTAQATRTGEMPPTKTPSSGSAAAKAKSQGTSTGDPTVDAALYAAAQQYNIPPAVMFAVAQQESGLNPNAVGDQGSSFGLYQEHVGGELTSYSGNNPALADDPSHAAQVFAQTLASARASNPNATWGQLAASAQRPADQAGYASSVNSRLGQAGQLPSAQAAQVLGNNVNTSLLTPSGGGGGSPGSFESVLAQAAQNPSFSNQLMSWLYGAYAPDIAGQNLTAAQSLAQAAVSPYGLQEATANLSTNTGYDLANSLLNVKGIQSQEKGLASQIGTAAKQQSNELQQYQNQLAQQALTQQGTAAQEAYLGIKVNPDGTISSTNDPNSQIGFAGQQYGLTQAGTNLQGQYLGEQEAAQAQQYGLTQQDLANQAAQSAAQYGYTQQSEALQGGYLSQEEQNAQQQYAVTQANLNLEQNQLAYESPLAIQGQTGAAAAAGATNTVGNQNALNTLRFNQNQTEQQLGLQGQQAALGYQAQQQGLAYQGGELGIQSGAAASAQAAAQQGFGLQGQQAALANTEAQQALGYQGGQLGLTEQGNALGYEQQLAQLGLQGTQLGLESQQNNLAAQLAALGQQSEVVGYQGNQQQYAQQLQQLQLAAKQAGIPAQQAISQLTYGLGQLGLQYDPSQLMAAAANAQKGVAGDISSVLSAAGAISGLGANFLQNAGKSSGFMQPAK